MKNLLRIDSFKSAVSFMSIVLVVIMIVNYLGQKFFFQIDLTEDKRFTISEPIKKLIKNVDQPIYIENFYTGDLPASFKRLQTATDEKIKDFVGLNHLIQVNQINTSEGTTEEINAIRQKLRDYGIAPTNVSIAEGDEKVEKLVYPTLIVRSGEKSITVNLLENDIPGASPDVVLNNSVSMLEYKIANAINHVTGDRKPIVMFLNGHGELSDIAIQDITTTLNERYQVGRLDLTKTSKIEDQVDVLIIAKPTLNFSQEDKLKIDQYIMNGGRVMWLIDKLAVDLDSIRPNKISKIPSYMASEYNLNIDDMLFKYGVRLQPQLALDVECSRIPLVTGQLGSAANIQYPQWYYHIAATPTTTHPIVKNMDRVNLLFANTIDTLKTKTPTSKNILLTTSARSLTQSILNPIGFEILRYQQDYSSFTQSALPLAVSIEGVFPSVYEGRVSAQQAASLKSTGITFKETSTPTKMIVVADGDIARNEIRTNQKGTFAMPLGMNPYDKYQYANKDFLLNSIEYLLDNNGLMMARNKEVKLRMLDKLKVQSEKMKWQVINIVLPGISVLIFGLIWNWNRKRKYGSTR